MSAVLLPQSDYVQPTVSTSITPGIVRPFPESAQRSTRGARTKKSTIYHIDTPEKDAVNDEHEEKEKRFDAKDFTIVIQ